MVEETRNKILSNDDFVLSETKKLQVLYKLKHEIRYSKERDAKDTESVAEHVFGILNLIEYFLPLENSSSWNREKIHKMGLVHDIDEIETGDTIGYLKTESDRAEEYNSMQKVIAQLPSSLQKDFQKIAKEYEAQETLEATFVKAIDRIEPLFHLYNEEGKMLLNELKTTYSQSASLKEKYVKPFPTISRFYQVISQKMLEEGFFTEEA